MADAHIPDKPALEGLETKWDAAWRTQGTYLFDRLRAAAVGREGVYSVDTPPPTASGSLHIGHVFSYTHTDVKVRFERMRGKTVFYPMGWDDNGLPTERRVQNFYGVRCDTSLPYDPDFTPPFHGDAKSLKPADQVPISRRNFIELCEALTEEDEKAFEAVFRQLGLSVDWTQTYRTISDETIRTSQLAFLRNLERGEAYHSMAPTLWDIDFRSAIAQAVDIATFSPSLTTLPLRMPSSRWMCSISYGLPSRKSPSSFSASFSPTFCTLPPPEISNSGVRKCSLTLLLVPLIWRHML